MNVSAISATLLAMLVLGTANAASLQICATSTGEIMAKKRCKGEETRLSLNSLIGPQGIPGPQGTPGTNGKNGVLDISSCRAVSSTESYFEAGNVMAAAFCDSGEFLLNYGFVTDPGDSMASKYLYGAEIVYGGEIPYGIVFGTQSLSDDSIPSPLAVLGDDSIASYSLTAIATCCPI